MAQDYKMKYMELRSRFVSSLDVAFRMGYEKGQQDSTLQQLQQQQQAAMQQQASQQQGPGGMEQDASQFEQQAQDVQQQGASEIEQGIQELEELLNKGEIDVNSAKSIIGLLNMSLNKLSSPSSLSKSEFVRGMIDGKELYKQSAINHNKQIQTKSEEAHSIQKKIVGDILKKWEDEERSTTNDILNTLKVEGKIK